jgi:Fe-S-cluster containining protein
MRSPIPIAKVDCGTCRACCRQLVLLVPEHGDDPARYDCDEITVLEGTGYALKKKPNGDCIYLDEEKGCTIYPHHPAVCRAFSCVGYFLRYTRAERRRLLKAGCYDPDIHKAGQERVKALLEGARELPQPVRGLAEPEAP